MIVIGNSCAGKTTFIDYFKNLYDIYSDIDDLLYQNKIEELKKIKNKIKYVNKIWGEYNDNINSINHYTKPAKLGEGHEVIKYYNEFKENKYGIKKDSKRYLAK